MHCANRREEKVRRCILCQKAVGACLQCVDYSAIPMESRQDNNFGPLRTGNNGSRRIHTIHFGHPKVHKQYVDSPRAREIHGFEAIRCDASKLQVGLRLN